jgi:hypothetical protein
VWTLIYYSLAFWWLTIPLRRENRQITVNNHLAVINGYWELSNCRRIILQCPSVVPVDNSILYIGLLHSTQLTQLIIRCILSLSQVINTLMGIHRLFIFLCFIFSYSGIRARFLTYYYCYFVNMDPVWSSITVLGQEENKRNGWLV